MMTECERIIKEKRLPENFFNDEVICDFFVDKTRKKIWAIGIDLLLQFDDVCRKHNLRYSLAFGTMLGVIRHHGFIPWDDDIDVVMPRKDYDELLSYRDEFMAPYYLQVPGEDGYYFSFIKLRNSNTSGISWPFRYEKFNQGLFIDIFPLDDCEENYEKIDRVEMERAIAICSTHMRMSNPFPNEKDSQMINMYSQYAVSGSLTLIDKVARKYEGDNRGFCSARVLTIYPWEKMTFEKSMMGDLVEMELYGHYFYMYAGYDYMLRTTYNNYEEFPPIEKRGTWHNTLYQNPDESYVTYLNVIRKEE